MHHGHTMDQTRLTLSLDSPTAAALADLAQQRGTTLDAVAHDLLADALLRAGCDLHHGLAALLAGDFEKARSWPELQGRLRLKGYDLRGLTGDLILVAYPSGDHLAGIASLNVDEAALIRRFGRSFPNTARRWDWDLEVDKHTSVIHEANAQHPGRAAKG